MTRTQIWITAGVIAAVAVIAIVFNVTAHHGKTPSGEAPGSKNSSVTAAPTATPKPTGTPVPPLPNECYRDNAPDYCKTLTVPGKGTPITADQIAGSTAVGDFVTQFGRFDSAETAAARSARLAPFVDGSATSVLTQHTELARADSGLIGLMGTAQTIVSYASFVAPGSDGNWTYKVTANFTASYTQSAAGATTNFSGPATFTVTVSKDSGHKVLAVHESIPAIEGAP